MLWTFALCPLSFSQWQRASPWKLLLLSCGTLLVKEAVTVAAVTTLSSRLPKLWSTIVFRRPVLLRCFAPYVGWYKGSQTSFRRVTQRYAMSAAVAFLYFHLQVWRQGGRLAPLKGCDGAPSSAVPGGVGVDVFPSWLHLFVWNEAFYPSLWSVLHLRLNLISGLHFSRAERCCAAATDVLSVAVPMIFRRFREWKASTVRAPVYVPLKYELLDAALSILPSAGIKFRRPSGFILQPLLRTLPAVLTKWLPELSEEDQMLLSLLYQEMFTVHVVETLNSIVGSAVDWLWPPTTKIDGDRAFRESMQLVKQIGFLSLKDKEWCIIQLTLAGANTTFPLHQRVAATHLLLLMYVWDAHKGMLPPTSLLTLSGLDFKEARFKEEFGEAAAGTAGGGAGDSVGSDESDVSSTPTQQSPVTVSREDDCSVCLQPLTTTVKSPTGGRDAVPELSTALFNGTSTADGGRRDRSAPTPLSSSSCVALLPCQHVFHSQCVADWVAESFTCPLCRVHLKRVQGAELLVGEEDMLGGDDDDDEEARRHRLMSRLSQPMTLSASDLQSRIPRFLSTRAPWLQFLLLRETCYFRAAPGLLHYVTSSGPRSPFDVYLLASFRRLFDL